MGCGGGPYASARTPPHWPWPSTTSRETFSTLTPNSSAALLPW